MESRLNQVSISGFLTFGSALSGEGGQERGASESQGVRVSAVYVSPCVSDRGGMC